jgi:hypothetical protein
MKDLVHPQRRELQPGTKQVKLGTRQLAKHFTSQDAISIVRRSGLNDAFGDGHGRGVHIRQHSLRATFSK